MPQKKETGKLVGAIIFYALVPSTVSIILSAILGFLLGLTMILAPLAIVVGLVLGSLGSAYMIMGIVFAILSFVGKKFG